MEVKMLNKRKIAIQAVKVIKELLKLSCGQEKIWTLKGRKYKVMRMWNY